MNPESSLSLWTRLDDAGVVSGPPPASPRPTPWYLAVLVGASAWMAALLLLGFLGMVVDDLFDGAGGVIVGGGCCLAALGLLRVGGGNGFLGQGGVALGLAGQVFIGISLFNLAGDTVTWCVMAAGALLMHALDRTPMHRFLCGGVFAVAVTGLCHELGDRGTVLALPLLAWLAMLLWWSERRDPALRLSPLAWALSLAALVLAWVGGDRHGLDDLGPLWQQAAQITTAALLPATVATLLASRGRWRVADVLLLAGAIAVALLWLHAPGIAVGLALALAGFALHRPALLVIGLAGIGAYLLFYYYQLQVPLLQKSLWLTASGATLLLARLAWLRLTRRSA